MSEQTIAERLVIIRSLLAELFRDMHELEMEARDLEAILGQGGTEDGHP